MENGGIAVSMENGSSFGSDPSAQKLDCTFVNTIIST